MNQKTQIEIQLSTHGDTQMGRKADCKIWLLKRMCKRIVDEIATPTPVYTWNNIWQVFFAFAPTQFIFIQN